MPARPLKSFPLSEMLTCVTKTDVCSAVCAPATFPATGGLPVLATVPSWDYQLALEAEPSGLTGVNTEPVALCLLRVCPSGGRKVSWGSEWPPPGVWAWKLYSDGSRRGPGMPGAPPGTPAQTSLSVPFSCRLWSLRVSPRPSGRGIRLEKPAAGLESPSTSRQLLSTDDMPGVVHTAVWGGREQHRAPGRPPGAQRARGFLVARPGGTMTREP